MGKSSASGFGISGKFEQIKNGVYELEGTGAKIVVTHEVTKMWEDNDALEEVRVAFKKANRFAMGEGTQEEVVYKLYEDYSEFEEFIQRCREYDETLYVACDIETTGLNYRLPDAKIRTLAIATSGYSALVLPIEGDPKWLALAQEFFDLPNVRSIWQGGWFDLSYLRVAGGVRVNATEADTMLQAYLLKPGRGKFGYGLKPLSMEYTDLGKYDTDIKGGDWATIPIEELATYNATDAVATYRIWEIQTAKIEELEMGVPNRLLADAVQMVCELQINGVKIDSEEVARCIQPLEDIIAGYKSEMTKLIGKEWDWNSPQEMDKLIYDVLQNPRPEYTVKSTNTDDDALDLLNTPFTNILRKHRKASKMLGTYYKGYFAPERLDAEGRLHAEFNLHATRTGRLSSDNPNLQNISKSFGKDDIAYEDLGKFKIKNCIVSSDGRTLLAAD